MGKKKSGYNKYIAFGIAIVLFVTFFWPKTNSIWDDGATATLAGKTYYKNMVCACIGFTALRNDCKSCTQHVDCYGVPVSCSFSCRQEANGTWRDVSCGDLDSNLSNNSSNSSYPADKDSCESQGGQWGPVGLSPKEICVMPTTDAGKVCSDSRDCQSACVANLSVADYNNLVKYHIPIHTTGRCTAWKVGVGCNAYVENGVVNGILCVD